MQFIEDLRASRRAFLAAASSVAAMPLLPRAARGAGAPALLVIDTVEGPAPSPPGALRLTLAGERLARLQAMEQQIRALRRGDTIEAHLDQADLVFLDVAVQRSGHTVRQSGGPRPTRLAIV